LNDIQAVIFANGFILGFEESYLSRIFEHFGLEEYKIMKYKKDLDLLFDKKLFKETRKHRRENTFEIPKSVTSAIIENIRFQDFTNAKERDFVSVLEEFDSYSDMFDDEIISYSELNYKIEKLLKEHSEIQIIKHILSWKLNDFEVYFFLDTLWDAIKAGDNDFNTHLARTIDDFHKRSEER